MTLFTGFEVQEIALTTLVPHPQNPRLTTQQEVVDQIAAQLTATGIFHPAFALLTRQRPDGETYKIISGFHRWLAAQKASLETVPCWVREMSDEDAYMALLLTNTQNELHPLEEGLRALKSGLSVRVYATKIERAANFIQRRMEATRVAMACTESLSEKSPMPHPGSGRADRHWRVEVV